MRFYSAPAALCVAAALAACTPTYNWREVRLEASPLVTLLPCKPDQARREVALAGRSLPLAMKGCEAGGATFAVAFVEVGDASRLAEVLAAWRAATLANLQATGVQESTFLPPGGVALQGAAQISAAGRQPDGAATRARAAWFARGTQVYQALAIAPQLDAEAADTFFAGLRLP